MGGDPNWMARGRINREQLDIERSSVRCETEISTNKKQRGPILAAFFAGGWGF
jgi:hypothetical protein